MTSTRSETFCTIFGYPVKLKETVLPTYADIMKHFLWIKNDIMSKQGNKKDPSVKYISDIVSSDIENVWKKASLPVVSRQEIIRLIKNYNEKYKNIKKIPKSRKGVDKIKKDFLEQAKSTLFDISRCKCIDFEKCKCALKVPSMERQFLTDQRHERKMTIGSIDISTSQKLKRARERQRRRENQEEKAKKLQETASSKNITDVEVSAVLRSDSELEDISENDDDYVIPEAKHLKTADDETPSTSKSCQMRTSLPNLAIACDRTGVSDRSAAIIASSLLRDIGIISEDTPSKVIDRSKLRRERRKVQSQLKSTQETQSLYAIYFDGRKDKIIMQE